MDLKKVNGKRLPRQINLLIWEVLNLLILRSNIIGLLQIKRACQRTDILKDLMNIMELLFDSD
jgi:hypothetical protein